MYKEFYIHLKTENICLVILQNHFYHVLNDDKTLSRSFKMNKKGMRLIFIHLHWVERKILMFKKHWGGKAAFKQTSNEKLIPFKH